MGEGRRNHRRPRPVPSPQPASSVGSREKAVYPPNSKAHLYPASGFSNYLPLLWISPAGETYGRRLDPR